MTDAFDRAMADIAIKSADNGGPTTQDILVALQAGHDAATQTAAELAKKTEEAAKELAVELKRIVAHLESESGHTADAIRASYSEAIKAVKLEVLEEIEQRESWPVLDRALTEMCAKIDARYPRRATDPQSEDWAARREHAGRDLDDPADSQFTEHRESAFPEDEEMGDLRRAWRFGKWFVAALVLIAADMFARFLSRILFGYPS